MSTDYCCVPQADAAPFVVVPATRRRPLHRLATVRRQQGVSRHAIARQLNIEVEQVRQQENENSDLSLSMLYAWQSILDVPIGELLVEPDDGLPSSILLRSQMVRLMKTVQTISENTKQESIRARAQTMVGQLVEIMPEVADVGPWNINGAPRRPSDLGLTAHRRMSDDLFVDRDSGYAQHCASVAGNRSYASCATLETA